MRVPAMEKDNTAAGSKVSVKGSQLMVKNPTAAVGSKISVKGSVLQTTEKKQKADEKTSKMSDKGSSLHVPVMEKKNIAAGSKVSVKGSQLMVKKHTAAEASKTKKHATKRGNMLSHCLILLRYSLTRIYSLLLFWANRLQSITSAIG